MNNSNKTRCNRVIQKFDVFPQRSTKMLIPKTALFEFWSKSEKKPKGTTLCFAKKMEQNLISRGKIDFLNNSGKTCVVGI